MRQFTLKKTKPSRKQFSHSKTFKKELGITPIPASGTITHFPYYITDQNASGIGNDCTAYAAKEIRQTNTGKVYDPDKFWLGETLLGATEGGATLDIQGQAGIKTGWNEVGTNINERAKQYFWVRPSYFGGPDWFDTLRQAILLQGPLSGGLTWYSSWDNGKNGIIPHVSQNPLGGHCVTLTNLNCIDGVDYIDVSVHWGNQVGDKGLYRLDRFMANKVFSDYGVIYWPKDEIEIIKKEGILVSLLARLVTLFTQLVQKKVEEKTVEIDVTPPPQVPVKTSRIRDWGKYIQFSEGWKVGSRSYRNSNPGNIKATPYGMSLGATRGIDHAGIKDGEYGFCIYENYDVGFNALCQLLTDAAQDKLKGFHDHLVELKDGRKVSARTLEGFTEIFAEPEDEHYLNSICVQLKVDKSINISELL